METQFINLWHQWLWPVLEFIIGLGVVIFIHELGHFIVAKKVDIKVEQFALGFGTRLFGFKRGETDYRVNLIPLGGYVKMVGQEDFGPVQEPESRDPRSFPAKPVSSRLAVVAAGVVMNVLLAAVLFIIVCLVGIRFPAPVIGGIVPGSPAEDAKINWLKSDRPVSIGLKPGDRILKVDDKTITRFNQISAIAALADAGQVFHVLLARRLDGDDLEGEARISVAEMGGLLHFGLIPAAGTTLAGTGDMIVDSPFMPGDSILAINGQPVRYHWQIPEVEKHLSGRPVTTTILRNHKKIEIEVEPRLRIDSGVFFLKDGTRLAGKMVDYQPAKGTVVIRPPDRTEKTLHLDQVVWPARSEILDILGLVPRLRVTGVGRGSPADRAGLRPGDIILEYAGQPLPSLGEFLHLNEQAAEKGTTIVILRENQRLSLPIRPERQKGSVVAGITAGLDLSHPVVAYIRPGSPAARAGIARGDLFTGVGAGRAGNWNELFEDLKASPDKELTLFIKQADPSEQAARLGLLSPSVFSPEDYRYVLFTGPQSFTILMGPEVRKNPASAVAWGFRETWDFIAMTYASLVSYFRGTVSSKEFSGPVGIGSIAIQVGRQGIIPFVYFMAVISVSLAVINFLPIPVVDGGQAVFLLIEKIIGRPVPLKIQNAVTMVGWTLMIMLFLALTWNDIARIMGQ